MAGTVILSEETVRQLLEAHASRAAWYYQMAAVLRDVGAGVHPPTDEQRTAYLNAAGQHFRELQATIQQMGTPRPYVPPPVVTLPAEIKENEGVEVSAAPPDHIPTPDHIAPPSAAAPPASAPEPALAPPPMVDPSAVKYE
ncbi:MAG: hypothetical protein AAGA56_10660 [Myxococcota bacterium]